MARKLRLDIDGDAAGARAALDAAADALKKVARHLDDVGDEAAQAERKVNGLDRALDKLRVNMGKFAKTVATSEFAKAMTKATGYIAAVGSLSGPAVTGIVKLGKGAAVAAHAFAAMAPAAAILPVLAAGIKLVEVSLKAVAPAVAKAFTPFGEAFAKTSDAAGKLAAQGLPKLASEFVKVNFPAIDAAIRRIAQAENTVVTESLKWANSAAGVAVIRDLTKRTADEMQNLAKPLSRVVVAFGNLVGRATDPAFTAIGEVLERAADATARWADNISQRKIWDAFDRIGDAFFKVKQFGQAIRDVGKWIDDNQGKVKAFSDVLAATAIAVGLATGNVLAVIGGAFSLAVNHWEQAKTVFAGAVSFLSGVWKTIQLIFDTQQARDIWESMKEAFGGFVDSFKKQTADIGPKFWDMVHALMDAWDEWAPIISAWWQGVGKPALSALGTIVGWVAVQFVEGMTVAAKAVEILGAAFHVLWSVFSTVVGNIINGAAAAFGWIPGIGPKLQEAAKEFNDFRDRVNNALAGIKDRTVSVRATFTSAGGVHIGEGSSIPLKGGFAEGGTARVAGFYRVGERGPEVVHLPAGATVTPNGGGRAAATTLTIGSTGGRFENLLAQLLMEMQRTGRLSLR